ISWKDWFKGLCGLVVLIGILEYPDVPKSMFGIPGLNFFNLLLLNLTLAWMVGRSRERLAWDMPSHIAALLSLYVAVILIGWLRLYFDRGLMSATETTGSIISEYLVNTLKWMTPCLLLFDGCRSRERLRLAAFSLLGAYVFLAVMTIKVMPLGAAFLGGTELQRLALKLLVSRIGYHRVTLSMMLGGAAWAVIAAAPLLDRRLRWTMPIVSLVGVYAQFLTGGRGGIVTLGVIGLLLGLLKWRKVFLVAPLAAALFYVIEPSAYDRLLQGFVKEPDIVGTQTEINEYELTSGRNIIWPYVIRQIEQKPWTGWGRQAMLRTGTVAFLYTELKEDFGHPHNAYLETLLDNGIIGTLPVLALFLTLLFHSLRLFLERRSVLCNVAGGLAATTILALMVAGMSSQSFYPIEGTVEMWCAIGLMVRLAVERARALATLAPKRPPLALVTSAGPRIPAAPAKVDLDTLIFGGTDAARPPAPAPAARPPFSAAARQAARFRSGAPVEPAAGARFRF